MFHRIPIRFCCRTKYFSEPPWTCVCSDSNWAVRSVCWTVMWLKLQHSYRMQASKSKNHCGPKL